MIDVMRGDEIRNVNESNNSLLLYIRADDSGENCEEKDGCVVLDYALIFKEWVQLSNNWEQVSLQSKSRDLLTWRFGKLLPAKDDVTLYFLYKNKNAETYQFARYPK